MKFKDIISLIVLGMAGGTIYLLPYMKYYFYNQMIDNTGLSGQDLGFLVCMFGISSMFVLLPGGIIADRLSSRKCIFVSLIATTILTVVYSFLYTSYIASLIIWFLLAFTTLFLAWPAIFKSVRIIGKNHSSTAYSIYYASTGLTGALIGYITIEVYGFLSSTNQTNAYFWAIWVSAIANTIVAYILFYLLSDIKENSDNNEKIPTIKECCAVLKLPAIWIISIILFCTYTLHVGMTFFTPYLTSAFGVSNETSGVLTLIRSYVFMSLTPLTGIIADRYFKSTLKWFLVVYPVIIIGLLVIINLRADINTTVVALILSMFIAFFVCSIYASMYSILSECKIPMAVAGTAIGLVSIFSYTPDTIMQPLFGYFADINQYHSIFSVLIMAAVLSSISCLVLLKINKKYIARI